MSLQADQLYRGAHQAMSGGDAVRAIALFDRVATRFPGTPYATSALYYRAFLQYQQYHQGNPTPLRQALAALRQLRREYPSAPQVTDAHTLETRICGELAQLGDSACRRQVVIAAQPLHIVWAPSVPLHRGGEGVGSRVVLNRGGIRIVFGDTTCHKDKQVDEWIAALNSLWKVDSTLAMQATGQVLSDRDRCLVRLRSQAILILTQRSVPIMAMAPVVFNTAQEDPAPEVRQLAKLWLLSQQWDPPAASFLHTVFGEDFHIRDTAMR